MSISCHGCMAVVYNSLVLDSLW